MVRARRVSTTKNAIRILDQMIGADAALRKRVAKECLNAEIAQMIYDARVKAGMTQAQLAKLIGTRQPVIARLEDADYEGHSLSMLQKIAAALGFNLKIEFSRKRLAT